jgi:hypothetical protein
VSSSPTRASATTPTRASEATEITSIFCASSRAGSRSEAQRSRKPIRSGARIITSARSRLPSMPASAAIAAVVASSSTARLTTTSSRRRTCVSGAAPIPVRGRICTAQ